jgi:hypothetical protein
MKKLEAGNKSKKSVSRVYIDGFLGGGGGGIVFRTKYRPQVVWLNGTVKRANEIE